MEHKSIIDTKTFEILWAVWTGGGSSWWAWAVAAQHAYRSEPLRSLRHAYTRRYTHVYTHVHAHIHAHVYTGSAHSSVVEYTEDPGLDVGNMAVQ